MAVGYYGNGNKAPLFDWGWVGPAAQMYSTITDLNKASPVRSIYKPRIIIIIIRGLSELDLVVF